MNWPDLTETRWKWVALAIAIPCLIAGLWLIIDYIGSSPPDFAHDDPDQVMRFVMSRGFDRLSEVERQRNVATMMRRYATLDEEQRQQVDRAIRTQYESHGDQFRERMFEMWRTYVISEARQYLEVPPDDRSDWMHQRVEAWQMMGAPMGREGGRPDRNRDQERSMQLTPERQERVVRFFQSEIIPRSNAEERALVALLFHDAARQFRERDR